MPSPLWSARHVSISIDRPPADVYQFAANPENLLRWAQGLATALTQGPGGAWLAESPMGRISIRFAERNPFGVLDHDVTLPSGATVHNPLRVLPNASGSEVVFTVFQRPGMTDAQLAADAEAVERDLRSLKALLEPPPRALSGGCWPLISRSLGVTLEEPEALLSSDNVHSVRT